MSDVEIRVDSLSKLYAIGPRALRGQTIRESLAEMMLASFRFFLKPGRDVATIDHARNIWALRAVSFEVRHGEIRSEERRVGKECRSRWGADHEKKDDRRWSPIANRP